MLGWLIGVKCPFCGSRKTKKCTGYEAQKYQDENIYKKYGPTIGRIAGMMTGVPHGGTIGSKLGKIGHLLPGTKLQEWIVGKASDTILGQSYFCKNCKKPFYKR